MLTYELLTGASPFTVDGESNSQSEISRYQSNYVHLSHMDFISLIILDESISNQGLFNDIFKRL